MPCPAPTGALSSLSALSLCSHPGEEAIHRGLASPCHGHRREQIWRVAELERGLLLESLTVYWRRRRGSREGERMVWQGEGGREGEWWEVRIGFVSPWKSGVASSPVGLKTPTPHSLLGPQDFGPEATGGSFCWFPISPFPCPECVGNRDSA